MALIICPECGKEVSDKSPQCIHCGYPFENTTNETQNRLRTNVNYKVMLTSVGGNKMAVIKAVKDLSGWGLAASKQVVDNSPSCIASGVSSEECRAIEEVFVGIGAKVEFCEMSRNEEEKIPNVSVMNASKNSRICPTCKKAISKNANNCPFCGHTFVQPTPKSGMGFWKVVGAIIVAVLIIMYL